MLCWANLNIWIGNFLSTYIKQEKRMSFELFLIIGGAALILVANLARLHQRCSDEKYAEDREEFILDAQAFAAKSKQIIGKQ